MKKTKLFLFLILLTLIVLTITSCQPNQTTHQFENNNQDQIKIAAISDIHGQLEKLNQVTTYINNNQDIKAILVAGDLVNNEKFSKRGIKYDDKLEAIKVLELLAKTNLPILVIPGNHENIDNYNYAIKKAKQSNPNLIDMHQIRLFQSNYFNVISIPGYTDKRYSAPNAFIATPLYIKQTKNYISKITNNKPTILLSHGAAKTTNPGPTTYQNQDVGNQEIKQLMQQANIKFNIAGNIHEAGGLAVDINNNKITPNQLTSSLILNAGFLENWKLINNKQSKGMFTILTIKDNQISYEIINLK